MSGKLMMDLRERDCRYPLWDHKFKFDPETDCFCGKPVVEGYARRFCAVHANLTAEHKTQPRG